MDKTSILRVWGKCDNFDIEFTHIGGEKWETTVPPDTKDGVYAVEIWAINEFSELAHWTGELYMCGGICCIRFFSPKYSVSFSKRKHHIGISKRHIISFKKGCQYVR